MKSRLSQSPVTHALLGLALLTLAACGQRGSLYLPSDLPADANAASVQTTSTTPCSTPTCSVIEATDTAAPPTTVPTDAEQAPIEIKENSAP